MQPSFSIVVISYDYAEFLPAAIDSALAQTHPAEVLVVDDGSTDGSREIIESYGDRIRSLYKHNGGNSSVVNVGVPATSGDVVMFLDADDVLHPDAVAEVARAWQEDCCKVQFRLALIDGSGARRGVDPPLDVPMPDGDVVPQILSTGRYVTPVTTGNAFRREVLDQLLPIPEDDFRNTNDGYLNPLCPFYGPVRSIDRELGGYRLHGRNLWAFSGGVDLAGIRQRLVYDLTRQRYVAQAARQRGHDLPPDLLLRDPLHVLQRLVCLRLDRHAHPVPFDGVWRLVRAGMAGAAAGSLVRDPVQRALMCAAVPVAAVLPRALLPRLAGLVLVSRPRHPLVRLLARVVRQGPRSVREQLRRLLRRGGPPHQG